MSSCLGAERNFFADDHVCIQDDTANVGPDQIAATLDKASQVLGGFVEMIACIR